MIKHIHRKTQFVVRCEIKSDRVIMTIPKINYNTTTAMENNKINTRSINQDL